MKIVNIGAGRGMAFRSGASVSEEQLVQALLASPQVVLTEAETRELICELLCVYEEETYVYRPVKPFNSGATAITH